LPQGVAHRYRHPLVDLIRHRGIAVPAPPGERIEPGSLNGSLPPEDHAVKRTFQPNTRRRARKHGFRTRMRTRAGRAIVKARRFKGRRKLTA
jgi:large subunit ribosomal protein L34